MKQASAMILSSADIQRILGDDPVIRQEARLAIVDAKPGFGFDEYVYIYIERYPVVDEFEATWRIWVQDGGSVVADLVLQALARLLPKFDFHGTHYSTTDFKSKDTVVRPAEEIALEKVAAATGSIEQRFAALAADIRNKLGAVSNGSDGLDGAPGLDGKDGRDGRDGKDGRDLVATDANLEDLQNVEQNIAKEDGQVLTWKDGVWQNLFIPQVFSAGGTGSGGGLGEDDVRTIVGMDVTGEPLGHVNREDSVMSFDNATRTFAIEPAVSGVPFEVWLAGGKRRYYDTAQTVELPAADGGYYVVFDENGDLVWIPGYPDWPNHALTSYVFWSETNQQLVYMGEERHGVTMDWQTHEYLHRTRGASLANGFGAYGFTDTGNGSQDADAQISISNGTFFDEDVQVDISHSDTPAADAFEQILQGPARIPVLYRIGDTWTLDAATEFPCKRGTSTLYYNSDNGGTWEIQEAPNNRYVNMWLVATSNLISPVMAVMGQNYYSSISKAASVKFGDLDIGGFITPEWRQLYHVVFSTSANYTNQPHAHIAAVIDIRVTDDLEVGQKPGVSYLDDLLDVEAASPSDNEVIAWSAINSRWEATTLAARAIVSNVPPTTHGDGSSLLEGDLWWKSDTGALHIYYGSAWIEISGGSGGGAVDSVNGKTGIVFLDADDIPVTNTVNKFTTAADISKLAGIEAGAQVNEVEEAPQDDNYYVRQNGSWVNLKNALSDLGVSIAKVADGGNFTTGGTTATNTTPADGGNFTDGTSSAVDNTTYDGGAT